MTPKIKKFLEELAADSEAWERKHFGDNKEALSAHYAYCLQVARGTEPPTTILPGFNTI